MRKKYILDTKTILQTPSCLEGFEDNEVLVTETTVNELIAVQKKGGENAARASEVIRYLDKLRQEGSLGGGVRTKSGGVLKVVRDGKPAILPAGFSEQLPGNRIIATGLALAEESRIPVVLVSSDPAMRVATSICIGIKGIPLGIESYKNAEVEDSGYTGHEEYVLANPNLINDIYKKKVVKSPRAFVENEFITLKCGSQSAGTMYKKGELFLVSPKNLYGPIRPKNIMQSYAIEALTASPDEIPLVILSGPAGTAKTLLALAAGIGETYESQFGEGQYYKMVLSRPNYISSDPGIGYLPGTMDEKMDPLIGPIYDNMHVILSQDWSGPESSFEVQKQIEDIFRSCIEVTALSYIRGRSLNNTYLMVDEAQNATRELIRDVITRAGKGTKVVLCGDPDQVDAVSLDSKTNGMVYAIEAMKNSPLSAIVRFDKGNSVRSKLAKEAILKM